MIKFLIWLDTKIRESNSESLIFHLMWKFSVSMNMHYLSKLKKNITNKKGKEFFKSNEDNIWLLVQHLDDFPLIQNQWLTIFKLFGSDLTNQAYLEDRVMVNLKGVQRYGTQIKENGDHYILYPILGMEHGVGINDIDIQDLNRRRKKMKLNPIEDYFDELYKTSKVFVKI